MGNNQETGKEKNEWKTQTPSGEETDRQSLNNEYFQNECISIVCRFAKYPLRIMSKRC